MKSCEKEPLPRATQTEQQRHMFRGVMRVTQAGVVVEQPYHRGGRDEEGMLAGRERACDGEEGGKSWEITKSVVSDLTSMVAMA